MRTFGALFLVALATAALADGPVCPPNYAYSGFTQPSQWQYIEDAKCGTEPLQSPIDIAPHFLTDHSKPIDIHYVGMPVTVINTGYDFRLLPTTKNFIEVGGVTAVLDNIHLHTPSEHKVDNQFYAAEIHFVHKEPATGKIFVIAVLLRETAGANKALQPIIDQLPVNLCKTSDRPLQLEPLLPEKISRYYRYVGSLTTPPCSGDVTFLVLPHPMSIGHDQLQKLRHFGANARPLQPRRDREITYVTH